MEVRPSGSFKVRMLNPAYMQSVMEVMSSGNSQSTISSPLSIKCKGIS